MDAVDDIEICRAKINALLVEYNCEVISADEYTQTLIRDKDTEECKQLNYGGGRF